MGLPVLGCVPHILYEECVKCLDPCNVVGLTATVATVATLASCLAIASRLATSATIGCLTCGGVINAKLLFGRLHSIVRPRAGAISAFGEPCIRHRGAAYLFGVPPPVAPMKKFIFTPLLVHYSPRYHLILTIDAPSWYIVILSILIAGRAIHGTLFGRICSILGPLRTSIHFLDFRF